MFHPLFSAPKCSKKTFPAHRSGPVDVTCAVGVGVGARDVVGYSLSSVMELPVGWKSYQSYWMDENDRVARGDFKGYNWDKLTYYLFGCIFRESTTRKVMLIKISCKNTSFRMLSLMTSGCNACRSMSLGFSGIWDRYLKGIIAGWASRT